MKTWGDVYFRMLGLGYDHGYAAYRADLWEARQRSPQEPETPAARGLGIFTIPAPAAVTSQHQDGGGSEMPRPNCKGDDADPR